MSHNVLVLVALGSAFVASAGCASSNDQDASAPAATWRIDCADPLADGSGACFEWFFDGMAATEATLATQSNDAQRIAVAWQQQDVGGQGIHVAVSSDGGASWQRSSFAGPDPTGLGAQALYDPNVLALDDGTVVVVYGGYGMVGANGGVGGALAFAWLPIQVVRSMDGGATWSMGFVPPPPGGMVAADYWNVALAPDGSLYLAANAAAFAGCVWAVDTWQCPTKGLGILLWSSADSGATWQGPVLVSDPTTSHQIQPRVVAGSGLVVIHAYDLDAQHAVLDVSHDGGQTWQVQTVPEDVLIAARGIRIFGSGLVVVGYHEANVTMRRSTDGATWTDPEVIGVLPAPGRQWAVLDQASNGGLALLAEYDAPCTDDRPARWGTTVLAGAGTRWQAIPMAGPLEARPVCGVGNDYGGLAFAADGSLWASWSDPRAGAAPGIVVAHLVSSL